MKEVDLPTVEIALTTLINILPTASSNQIIIIISWIKTLFINVQINLSINILQSIKDAVQYVSSNKDQLELKEEEMVDINVVLSYINSKSVRSEGYSTLINNFTNN